MDAQIGEVISSLSQRLIELSEHLPDEDPKFEETLKVISGKQGLENNKIMLFSTFRHTLNYLKRKLSSLGYRVEQIDGSVKDDDRYTLKGRFELPKENPDAIDILLFTEVGSEGLDYQFCDMMINYDLPWNPMRIEQRIGRIDRRGQQSESVNIYNIITEDTVDAEIYYRCLMRIGVFEQSIGDCEQILGDISTGIESIALDTTLTEEERKIKLEQMADNEVRKVQELTRLEEEEKELFGFDLTEFTTSQEIRKAENPWLTQQCLQRLIESYINQRVGAGTYIIGETGMKNLGLSANARSILRDDLRLLPGGRNALRRTWENYLRGKKPNHTLTFDPEMAMKDRNSFFITSMHPLAKLTVPMVCHVPFKLDASREFVDPQDNNLWFQEASGFLSELIDFVYLDFCQVVKEDIVRYIPKEKENLFAVNNGKEQCLRQQKSFAGSHYLTLPLFFTLDGAYHKAEEIFCFNQEEQIAEPETVYRLMGYQRFLFISSASTIGLGIKTERYVNNNLFRRALSVPKITSEALDYLDRADYAYSEKQLSNQDKLTLTPEQIEEIFRHRRLAALLKNVGCDCVKKNMRMRFSVSDGDEQSLRDVLYESFEISEAPKLVEQFMLYCREKCICLDIGDNEFLPCYNAICLSRNNPLTSFAAFCGAIDS